MQRDRSMTYTPIGTAPNACHHTCTRARNATHMLLTPTQTQPVIPPLNLVKFYIFFVPTHLGREAGGPRSCSIGQCRRMQGRQALVSCCEGRLGPTRATNKAKTLSLNVGVRMARTKKQLCKLEKNPRKKKHLQSFQSSSREVNGEEKRDVGNAKSMAKHDMTRQGSARQE